jgi:type IV pilus assembly protein PilV
MNSKIYKLRRYLDLSDHRAVVRRTPVTGFTLIEVLVALLVLSIGLLGLAALQTFGMKFNQQSYQRTQAVFQTYDIIDRIRANPAGKISGSYDSVAAGSIPAVSTNCASTTCDTSQLATYDINRWNTANSQLLGQGRGAITTSGSRRTITITWIEEDKTVSMVTEVDL